MYFQRLPLQDYVSIERIFDMIRKELNDSLEADIHISKYHSKGIWKRIYNIFEAYFYQSDINHITGDINYITYLLRGDKTILSIHGDYIISNNKILKWIYALLWIIIPINRVKYVLVVSDTLKKQMIKQYGCNPQKIKVIHNMLNPIFKPVPKSFNTQKPLILQVGTKPAKNIERLFEALQGIHCHLHLIGKLSKIHLNLIKEYNIKYSNSFSLTPYEMSFVYEKADIVTLISTYEGFGLPIIEANAVGRVVITGNVAAMPEVAGGAAHLVDPFDVEGIRKGIIKVIKEEKYRNKLIENGFENAKRFELKTIAFEYLRLYQKINEENM